MSIRFAVYLLSFLSQQSFAAPVRVVNTDFADPNLIKTDDGYYSFATTGNGLNVQVASSPDLKTWKLLTGHDAMPGPFPDWMAEGPMIWAPDVVKTDDNKYVMYVSTRTSKGGNKHCVGAATSSSIEGPYKAEKQALACPLNQGGAIDPAGFQDADGTRYVVYKIDGNSNGSQPTPIMLQRLASDGVTPKGDPTKLLDKTADDGPLIEAPSLVKKGDTYYLSFSSHLFSTKGYDVKYATAKKITGPYTRADKPLLVTGDKSNVGPLTAPGGSDFSEDGTKIVFHAWRDPDTVKGGRATYVADVSLKGGVITLD